jgi:hypothetical protein
VVTGQGFLDELRPLARRCITRHHYRGFLAIQRKLLDKQEPKLTKTVLYAFRVLLTGIHLLRTGEVEACLPRLAQEYRRPFLGELIAQKREVLAHLLEAVGVAGEVDVGVDQRQDVHQGAQHPVYLLRAAGRLPHPLEEGPLVGPIAEHREILVPADLGEELLEDVAVTTRLAPVNWGRAG